MEDRPIEEPRRASATSDAAACGDVFGCRATTNVPQLVANVSVQCLDASSRAAGACRAPGARGFGLATSAQPDVVPLLFDPPPQPPATSDATQTTPLPAATHLTRAWSPRSRRRGARARTRPGRRGSAPPRPRSRDAVHSSCAVASSSWICSDSSGEAVALQRRVDRETECAEHVPLAQPEERGRHRQVVVDAREGHGLRRMSRTARPGERRLRRVLDDAVAPTRRAPGAARRRRSLRYGPCGASAAASSAGGRRGSRRRRRPAPARPGGRGRGGRCRSIRTCRSRRPARLRSARPARPCPRCPHGR